MAPTAASSVLKRLDQWFLKPVVPVNPIEARMGRLVGALALIVTVATLIQIIGYPPTPAFVIAFLLAAVAYALSRWNRNRLASVLIVFLFTVPSYSLLFTAQLSIAGSIRQTGIYSPIVWMIFPLVLGSVLLRPRELFLYAVACVIGVMLAPGINPTAHREDAFISAGYLTTSSVILLATMLYRNYLEFLRQTELREANEKLRESEANLEKRVVERTHELDIALKEADQANKAKSQFLAAMSHELRTPLNAIINLSMFAGQGMLGEVNAEQSDAMMKVNSSGKHLLALINDVLDISKIESGSLQLVVEDDVDLCEELSNLQNTTKALLEGKPVQMVVDCADLPQIRADRLRVRQIFLNLISNACKFTDEGQIAIRARRSGDEIVVSFSDTGVGIDRKDFETIFETFRQTEVGLRKGQGTGLGLPISRRLAEAHHGRLWVESELGKGSTFFIALPIKSEQLEVTLESSPL